MNVRLERPTTDDPVARSVLLVTLAATAVGLLLLARAQLDGGPSHVDVRLDNRTGLPLEVGVGGGDGPVPLGQARAGRVTVVREVPDAGATWTFVATYAGREVYRESVVRDELRAAGWTVQIPAGATATLERAGFR